MPCWLCRFMISHAADSDREPGERTKRHIAGCAACRSFYEDWETVRRGLQAEAKALKQAPEHMTEQISRTLVEPPRRRAPISAGLKLAAAACLAVAALIGVRAMMRTQQPAPPADRNVPIVDLTGADLKTWTRLVERPLASEWENLASDTESGVRFVASCLNVSPIPRGPSQPY